VENFHPEDGVLQGYAQVPSGGGFNPDRVNVPTDNQGLLAGVLVVMVARSARGQVIVGWYKNATLMTESQDRTHDREGLFNFTGMAENAVLLPATARDFDIPKGRDAMGQSNVFYPLNEDGTPRDHEWIQRAILYIEAYRGHNMLGPDFTQPSASETTAGKEKAGHGRGQGRKGDTNERLAMEPDAAIEVVRAANDTEPCCQCGKPSPQKNRPVCVTCERRGTRAVFCRHGSALCFKAHLTQVHAGRKSFRIRTENIEPRGASGSQTSRQLDVLGGLICADSSRLKRRESVKQQRLGLSDAPDESLVEGARARVEANVYERNPEARRLCIEHYGSLCFVCHFDFGTAYGPYAKGFIHVHHVRPVSTIGHEYEIDPIADLRPVCPNCHAAIHLCDPAMTPDELRDVLQQRTED
jgi:hypothetical protein